MGTVLLHRPYVLLSFPTSYAFSKQPKLRTPVLSLKEIADGSLHSAFQKDLPPFKVSCLIRDGDRNRRRQLRRKISSRTQKVNQNDISALIKNVHSSISDKSICTNDRSSESSDRKSSAAAFLEDILQLRKQLGDKTSGKEGDRVLTKRTGVSKTEQRVLNDEPVLDSKLTQPLENQPAVDLKSIRPQSNFVKRSPIPSPSTGRGKIDEQLNDEALPVISRSEELESPTIEKMKLAELIEVAKSRGLKGYSKLKKAELLALLKSLE